MDGPPVTASVALPVWFVSSALVAFTEIKFGEGEVTGLYSPEESIDPQSGGLPHAAPLTDQNTCPFSVPVTLAVNNSCPSSGTVAFAG